MDVISAAGKGRAWCNDSVLTLYVCSDTHYGTSQNEDDGDPDERLVVALRSMPGRAHPRHGIVNEPDAVIVTGDLVHEGEESPSRFGQDFRRDGGGDVPWPSYFFDGNHDQNDVRALILARYGSLNWGFKIGHVWFQAFTENYTSPFVTTPPTAAQINAVAASMASRPAGEPTVLMVHRAFGTYEPEWAADALDAFEALALSKRTLFILNGHNHYDTVARAGANGETWRGFRVFSPGSVTQSPMPAPPYNVTYREALNVIRIGHDWYDVANFNFGFDMCGAHPCSNRPWNPGVWNWHIGARY